MTPLWIGVTFFLFVMACTGAVLLLFVWRLRARPLSPAPLATPDESGRWRPTLIRSMHFLGEMAAPDSGEAPRSLQQLLEAAGYLSPQALTVFHGVRIATVILAALTLGWLGLLAKERLDFAVLLAVSGGAFSFLMPARILRRLGRDRAARIERALPSGLDLMVLLLESGQTLDSTLSDTARELNGLYPELSTELQQVVLELRAGRSRADVFTDLGTRTRSLELRKVAAVMLDSDRFGTSLASALRAHARYLRTRRRQSAQEQARKLTTQMVFPIFFLIMPAVFVVTLGPAVVQFAEAMAGGGFGK